jgi:hypothetical protein
MFNIYIYQSKSAKSIFDLQFWPWPLAGKKENMGSAHSSVEVNIWAKFEENPSIGIGFIKQTR